MAFSVAKGIFFFIYKQVYPETTALVYCSPAYIAIDIMLAAQSYMKLPP